MLAAKFFRSLFTKEAKPRQHKARLGLDNLERRDVPSGTVMGVLSGNGKTWTITGDAAGNDINIEPTGNGSFTLTGNDTTVSGDTDVSGVENITIKMGDGDDVVNVNLSNTNNTLAGHLKIDGGNGANYAYVKDMTISKNLIVKNGTNASGQDQTYIEDTSVNGKVDVTNGNGDTRTEVYRNEPGTSTIGGALRIINGSGYDYNHMTDTNFNSNVLVRNGAPNSANQPGQTQFYNTQNPSQSSIRGNITVSYDGGANPGDERDGLWDYDVQGNVAYNYNEGAGDVRFDGYTVDEPAMIHGNLSIKGTGEMVVKVASQGYMKQGLWVGGKLTINTGGAADNIDLYKLIVDGKTTIKTGDGDDAVTLDDCMLAAFNLNTNKGNDTVKFDYWDGTSSVTTFTGKVKVNLGTGDDQMSLGTLGDDTAKVEFGDVAQIFGDGGNDTINQSNFAALNGDPITILA